MIAAVSTAYNEADIIGRSLRHLFAHGVDHVYVAHGPSSDDTQNVLDQVGFEYPGQLTVLHDESDYHFQPALMNALARAAALDGAEWILPVDADEFWYATDMTTIRAVLLGLPDSVRKLHVRQFMQRDWDHRFTDVYTLGKVAYRYEDGCQVTNGNHDVYLPSGSPAHPGVLDIRELQFRSFDHMARKCRERVDRLDPSLPVTDGAHQRRLAAMSEAEITAEWGRYMALPAVWDPIPTRC